MTTPDDEADHGLDQLALLGGLRLEDGQSWAAMATQWQQDDAAAALDLTGPRLHYLGRPRGGSKTTDAAALALVALLTGPPRSTSLVYASDQEQATILFDAALGLIERTPGLSAAFEVKGSRIIDRATRSEVRVQAADAAGALGFRPYLVVLDEIANWPTTRTYRRLWEHIVSGLSKRTDSRLVCLSTAGDPGHWFARVLAEAKSSPRWRVSEIAGPLPWADPEDLVEQRRLLPTSTYERLHLNRWAAGEDRLTTAESLNACVAHDGPLPPSSSTRYVLTVDLGLVNDATVLTVAHAIPATAPDGTPDRSAPPVVVLDRQLTRQGTKNAPVSISEVEELIATTATQYNRAEVLIDPWQAQGSIERLRARGVKITAWTFSSSSVGRLGAALHTALRDQRVQLYPDPDLMAELLTVKLKAGSTPGSVRLDHEHGDHDDRAVSLGMAVLALTDRPVTQGEGRITLPRGRFQRAQMSTSKANYTRDPRVRRTQLRRAAAAQPRGLRGIVGFGGNAPKEN